MRRLLALTSLSVLAACATVPTPAPAPAPPRPVPQPPAPASAPAPPPASADWRDWPMTPGNWVYRQTAQGSVAAYGADHHGTLFLQIRCDRAAGQLTVARTGAAPGTMTIRTSTTLRALASSAVEGGAAITLSAGDQLIDAMGYSRGRFIVETAPLAPLVVPSWAEVQRVTEDCRR